MIQKTTVFAVLSCLAALPATAQQWTAQATLSAPLSTEYAMSGQDIEDYADDFGKHMFIATAYRGPDDANGAPCADLDTVMFDVLTGYSGKLELQFLFDVTTGSDGALQVIDPAAFYNAGTRDDAFLVNIEIYDDPTTVSLNSMTCQPDGTVAVDFTFDFTGGSSTGKGPASLTVTGAVTVAGIELQNYDQY